MCQAEFWDTNIIQSDPGTRLKLSDRIQVRSLVLKKLVQALMFICS